MTRMKRISACLLSSSMITAVAQQPAKPKRTPSPGAIVFQQNCSRCHNAPQSFSPLISGTVIRHMRVRASLSQKDEEELLRFLNPK